MKSVAAVTNVSNTVRPQHNSASFPELVRWLESTFYNSSCANL